MKVEDTFETLLSYKIEGIEKIIEDYKKTHQQIKEIPKYYDLLDAVTKTIFYSWILYLIDIHIIKVNTERKLKSNNLNELMLIRAEFESIENRRSFDNGSSSKQILKTIKQRKKDLKDLYKHIEKYSLHAEKPNRKQKDIKEYLWFKVGLLFATGQMNKFYNISEKGDTVLKEGYTPNQIAKELKNSSYEKFILASINNYKETNTDKNIFFSEKKMNQIIEFCNSENIDIDDYFLSRLPTK